MNNLYISVSRPYLRMICCTFILFVILIFHSKSVLSWAFIDCRCQQLVTNIFVHILSLLNYLFPCERTGIILLLQTWMNSHYILPYFIAVKKLSTPDTSLYPSSLFLLSRESFRTETLFNSPMKERSDFSDLFPWEEPSL